MKTPERPTQNHEQRETTFSVFGTAFQLSAANTPEHRHRTTAFAEEIKKVPADRIAMIATSILKEGGMTAAEATAKAFEMLELAVAGKLSVDSYEEWKTGIGKIETVKDSWNATQSDDQVPDVSRRSDEGMPLPIPLPDVLNVLMPDRRRIKPTEREPRVRRWIMEAYESDNIEAGDILAAWKREGVPPQAFQHLRTTWRRWWEDSVRQTRKRSGESGASKKTKGKRGRVRRKTDKRLGAKTVGLHRAIKRSA